jgi:hypothetical protein
MKLLELDSKSSRTFGERIGALDIVATFVAPMNQTIQAGSTSPWHADTPKRRLCWFSILWRVLDEKLNRNMESSRPSGTDLPQKVAIMCLLHRAEEFSRKKAIMLPPSVVVPDHEDRSYPTRDLPSTSRPRSSGCQRARPCVCAKLFSLHSMSKKTLSLVVFDVKSACNNMATKLEMRLSGHQHMLERRRFVLKLMNTSYEVTRRTKAMSQDAAMPHVAIKQICSLQLRSFDNSCVCL